MSFWLHLLLDRCHTITGDENPKTPGVPLKALQLGFQDAPTCEKSKVQQSTTLSVTEAELFSGTDCARDLLFAMRIVESIGLMVIKPMKLVNDNKGAVDYANTWSSGGRMRHACIKLNF
jgi:hypothetical protein